MSKLVLIDAHAIIHRAYHAMPALTTPAGEPINAVYGFVSMLLRVIEDLQPTHLAVCFDRKEKTFRQKEYENYQAQRPEADEGLTSQFSKVRDTVKVLDIPVYDKAGYEADDLLGTLARIASKRDDIEEVIIVTGDKDILQLVTHKIHVYLPVRGLTDAKLMYRDDVYEKLGVWPEQVVDLKAFMGDPSDNYPGVRGIGPKTATTLLSKYKTYENVYKHLGDLGESTQKKLTEGKEGGDISKKLARIVTDLDIKPDFKEMTEWFVHPEKIEMLFDEYGFRSLKKRVLAGVKRRENEKQQSLF